MRYRVWGSTVAGFLVGFLLVLDVPDRTGADLMSDIHQGLQTTGKLFGINTIADVADLVAKGLASRRGPQEPPKPEPTPAQPQNDLLSQMPSMMTVMMRLLGLDSSQLGAMLINGFVFLAHIIGTNLGAFRTPASDASSPFPKDPPHADEPQPSGTTDSPKPGSTPLDWFLRNPSRHYRALLDQVQNTDLTEQLDREMDHLDQYPPEKTDCIRLLVCKVKPFIWKMQNVVRDQILTRANGAQTSQGSAQQPTGHAQTGEEILKSLHANLPTRDEFLRHGKVCERQFRHCPRPE